ncbi:hypothetical protein [Trinickia sp. EG282A]|uniref:hypothetical protein n=1 Tax=Trinickia sp. EG282A TaxID=3237013 RepID=UPI0034D2501B
MQKRACIATGRRSAVMTLAALAGVAVGGVPGFAATRAKEAKVAKQGRRKITQLIGSNGWPLSPKDVSVWQAMGLTWGRDSVGPGILPPLSDDKVEVDKTGAGFAFDLPAIIARNNRNGINSLLLLAYTPVWNASRPGDDKSAPKDVRSWERYVEAVVRKYSAPPYHLKYFQIWNEAAGPLTGGAPQATFWHGPNFDGDRHSGPYARAMQDYVDRIHIPAAQIIRKYDAYVVYGGWPDQGGLSHYFEWLEYRSSVHGARMLDWVDYLDIHYLGIPQMDALYQRYVANGDARGIWQTEIGDRYMEDPHFLPTYLFELAVWALGRDWNEDNKYVTMVYHWDGFEPFRLTHRGPPRTYNASGSSLIVLHRTVSGALSPCRISFRSDSDSHVRALCSDDAIVLQVTAAPGWRTVYLDDLPAVASSRFRIALIDAITGTRSPKESLVSGWERNALSIRFMVPKSTNGPPDEAPRHLAYLVLTPVA